MRTFEHINTLGDKFGIHFNEDSYNRVTGTQYEEGKVLIPREIKYCQMKRRSTKKRSVLSH
jgi:hypothetical protein